MEQTGSGRWVPKPAVRGSRVMVASGALIQNSWVVPPWGLLIHEPQKWKDQEPSAVLLLFVPLMTGQNATSDLRGHKDERSVLPRATSWKGGGPGLGGASEPGDSHTWWHVRG